MATENDGSQAILLLQRATNGQQVLNDRKKVELYVKENLWYRSVFLFAKSSLDRGKHLHTDYMTNCRSLLANGDLINAEDSVAESYMNCLWDGMVRDEKYQLWMGQKRSNTYQAVQNSFTGE